MSILIRCVYPVAPHLAHTLWQEVGYSALHGDILDTAWPKVDESALVRDELELMLQVNGKLRGSILVPSTMPKDEIEKVAVASEAVQKLLSGASVKKVIVVPGRLVNVVIA